MTCLSTPHRPNQPLRGGAYYNIEPHLVNVRDPGEDAGDGGHVPDVPGHVDPHVPPGPLLLLSSLGVSLPGLVTECVAEDVVGAEMQKWYRDLMLP